MESVNDAGAPVAGAEATQRFVVRVLARAIALAVAIYVPLTYLLITYVGPVRELPRGLAGIPSMLVVGGLVGFYGGLRPMQAWLRTEHEAAERYRLELEARADLQRFDATMHRAVEMASTEDAAYGVSSRALRETLQEQDAEMLLADSSDAHLKRVLTLTDVSDGAAEGPATCGVVAPSDCAAVRRAQTLQFASSESLDACPFLAGRSRELSATCVPVSVAGRSIGVIHAAGEVDRPVDESQVRRLEMVASHAGSRIGMLRVMSATTLQASTDPLTGLLNRRALENQVRGLLKRDATFSLAMVDLDHFKKLNDKHGHDAGDRALRLFARTAQSVLRGQDLVCRYGGEEFVFVFPGQRGDDVEVALGRLRHRLFEAVGEGEVPAFTASFGLAEVRLGETMEEVCHRADAALFEAKRAGRDRIHRAPEDPLDQEPAVARERFARAAPDDDGLPEPSLTLA